MTSVGVRCLLLLYVVTWQANSRLIISKDKPVDISYKDGTWNQDSHKLQEKMQNVGTIVKNQPLAYEHTVVNNMGKHTNALSSDRHVTVTSKLAGNEVLNGRNVQPVITKSDGILPRARPINDLHQQMQKSIENIRSITSHYGKLSVPTLHPKSRQQALKHGSGNFEKYNIIQSLLNSKRANSVRSANMLFRETVVHMHKPSLIYVEKIKETLNDVSKEHKMRKRNVNSIPLNATINPFSSHTTNNHNMDLLTSNQPESTVNTTTVNEMSVQTTSSIIAIIAESLPTDTPTSSQKPELISNDVNGKLTDEPIKVITPTVSNTPATTMPYQPLLSTTVGSTHTPLLPESKSISTPRSIMSSPKTKSLPSISMQLGSSHSSKTVTPQPIDITYVLQSDKYSTKINGVNTIPSLPEAVTSTTHTQTTPASSADTINTNSTTFVSEFTTNANPSSKKDDQTMSTGSGEITHETFTGLNILETILLPTTIYSPIFSFNQKSKLLTTESPAVNTIISDIDHVTTPSPQPLLPPVTIEVEQHVSEQLNETNNSMIEKQITSNPVTSSATSVPDGDIGDLFIPSTSLEPVNITESTSERISTYPMLISETEPTDTTLTTSSKSVVWTHSSTIVERSTATEPPLKSTTVFTRSSTISSSPKVTSQEAIDEDTSKNPIDPIPDTTLVSTPGTSTESTPKTTALPDTTTTLPVSTTTVSGVISVGTDSLPTNEVVPSSTTSPEPEPESEQGPLPNQSSVTDATISLAEPGPDWEVAKQQWSFAWEVHLYFFGSIFVLVALYTLVSVIRLWTFNRLLSKKYFVTLNLLIFVMCSLRGVYLLLDGYNSNGTYHPVIDYLLYSTAFPCLTSAFSILMFALLQATRMQIVPSSVQKFKVLIIIIIIHFMISIVTDVIVGLIVGMKIMLFVCQLIFILWGLFLFFGYAYIFRQVYGSAIKRQKLFYYSGNGAHSPNAQIKNKLTLSLAVKITFGTAIFGLVTVGLEIYGIAGVYGIFSEKKPSPWPWWSYHTVLRLTECLMCLTISYIASQPFRYRNKKQLCNCCFLCAPCLSMCCCDKSNKFSENIGWSDTDACSNNVSASAASSKKRIVLCDKADIIPIVIQPSSNHNDESRPNSLLIIEDGYVRFPTTNDINKMAASYNGISRPEVTNGIVNGAYQGQDISNKNALNEIKLTNFRRKDSMASSEHFRAPSSISLADSMASELDKAFKSMREDEIDELKNSLNITLDETNNLINNSKHIEAFLKGQPVKSGSLRRSNSDAGDMNIDSSTPRTKLYRSQSDNSGVIRTKQYDNMRYMSLLDLEQAMLDEPDQSDESVDLTQEDVYVRNPEIIRQCSREVDSNKCLLNDKVTEL